MPKLPHVVAAACLIALIGAACTRPGLAPAPATAATTPVQRGEYLVKIGGCDDCHTPLKMGPNGPEPDMARRLSGHPEGLKVGTPPAIDPASGWMMIGAVTATAYAGPWGISYAMNLTPDQNTGFGIWTEEMFVKAMREGKHMGTSRPILPPMPWMAYRHMTDDDLKAVFAYLKTLPAIANRVPEPTPPPPAHSIK